MKKLIINRGDRPNRFLNTLNQLRTINLVNEITRIEATLPHIAKKNKFKYLDPDAYTNIINNTGNTVIIPTWGALACAISHLRCWDIINDDYLSTGLIFEDDIEIYNKTTFQFCLQEAKTIVNQTLEPTIILFESNTNHTTKFINKNSRLLEVIGPFTGIHCYIINKAAAKYLTYNMTRFLYQIDIQIGLIAKQTKETSHPLRVYNYPEAGIKQRTDLDSDIQIINYNKQTITKYLPILPIHILDNIINYLPIKTNQYNYYSNFQSLPFSNIINDIYYDNYDNYDNY